MKKFVISEKPSVAADLAKALGTFKKFDDRYENDEYVISWAVGHLVELFMPEDFDASLKRWSLDTLPIIPEKFKTKPIEKVKKRFSELKKLIQRDDIDLLINGCDAGREGELIFTYIYELAKCKKPFVRLWLSSMTTQGIRDAFERLRSSEEMQHLQDAAKCRSEADWLIGINGTRAVTTKMFPVMARQVATVGRVQTPTLAMIVNRDIEIANFKPTKFWRILGTFSIHNGSYDGILQKDQKLDDKNLHDRTDRLWEYENALTIVEAVKNEQLAAISEQKKRSKQTSPRLYDLTTLQRESNSRYNMPASMTLKIAQSLYEKHKCITYPRTDSRALTEDYVPTCYKILAAINDEHRIFAQRIIENKAVNGNNRKIFNNRQVSDHFAIIPTSQVPQNLSEEEYKIFNMILKRFLCVFFPDAEFDVTTRISKVKGYSFKTEGKVLVIPGWLEVYGKNETEQDGVLPALSDGDGIPPQANVEEIKIVEDATRPPAPYNEATLLTAMEGAGKLLDDEELAEAMKERGLGTPATRAQIIEHLLALKYIVRDRKDLKATAKAEDLLNFLKAADIETLSSPALTGEWEYKLRQMENGNFTRKNFMEEIADLTAAIVTKTKNFVEGSDITKETSIISPTDNKPLMEGLRCYRSQDKALTIQKVIGGRKFSEDEIKELLVNKKIGPLDGFKSKTGSDFSASLVLDDAFKVSLVFENSNSEFKTATSLSKEEIDNLEVIGKCPLDGSDVVMMDTAYVCKNYFNKKCKLRISKKTLDKDIDVGQVQKLLVEKKTDLLEGFRSKRTGKLFSARLSLQKDGSFKFEFK
ncbi:MAG: DNA topoisomerase 3 [Puniceicoccales bacterium]|jgi:DNA topoisomerase-3|nr:DNA topoisomerase 3 [Puniceicoccales bacterium]